MLLCLCPCVHRDREGMRLDTCHKPGIFNSMCCTSHLPVPFHYSLSSELSGTLPLPHVCCSNGMNYSLLTDEEAFWTSPEWCWTRGRPHPHLLCCFRILFSSASEGLLLHLVQIQNFNFNFQVLTSVVSEDTGSSVADVWAVCEGPTPSKACRYPSWEPHYVLLVVGSYKNHWHISNHYPHMY